MKNVAAKKLDRIATALMMLALFFNPMGFDIVQYWLIQATGSLWRANFALYCAAGLFFGLSILFRLLYKKKLKQKYPKVD